MIKQLILDGILLRRPAATNFPAGRTLTRQVSVWWTGRVVWKA